MNKIILTLILTLGLTVTSYASRSYDHKNDSKPISENKIKRMDHKFTKHKAVKRNFKTQREFQHKKQKHRAHKKAKNMHYNNGYNYNVSKYKDNYNHTRQRGYGHYKRGWLLAYKYDRASFYDGQGYHYGFFNRYGYYFEDTFYRYDRYYTYKDRVKGRGLFDRKYYMPVNRKHYGFYQTGHYERY